LTSSPTKPFDTTDLDPVLTDADRLVMAETILAWADLDTGISRLIFLMFGIDSDAGSILIGNMDLKTKAERIKSLYSHLGNDAGAASFSKLSNAMREFSFSRNSIAHRKCIGRLKSEPSRLVFMSSRHVKGEQGSFEMIAIDRSEMIASAKFARDAAVTVANMINAIEAAGAASP